MRKVWVILLSLALLFGFVPQTVSAAQGQILEAGLDAYLEEVSAVRGFDVTKEKVEAYLSTYEAKLSDYQSIEELRTTLGEVIKADLSNLSSLYESYNLDEAALSNILADNGEELEDYVYVSELDLALFFYTYDNTFEREPDFDIKLADYLSVISEERGFKVTEERLEEALAVYGTKLDSFETVEEVKDYLGEVIKEDLSNLSLLYNAYRIDQKTLFELLEKNGQSINDYIYVYDLVEVINGSNSEIPIMDEAMLTKLFTLLDLTDAELSKMEAYFVSLESYFADAAFLEAFNSWTERITFLEEFDGLTELNEEQAAQIGAYFDELFSLMKLKPVIYAITDGKETMVSLEALALWKDFDYSTTDLKVILYGVDGSLLADFFVTSDIIEYLSGIYGELPAPSEEGTANPMIQPNNQKPSVPKTENGGRLPETSTNRLPLVILGGCLVLIGIVMYKKVIYVKKDSLR